MKIRKSNERGHANHGWLDTYHTFSFADYYDPQWMGFRSLRVINDDLVMPGKGFGTHPHRDMEIITYILSGALEHKDSMGNGRVIRRGRGAIHGRRHRRAAQRIQSQARRGGAPAANLDSARPKGVTPRYAEKSLAAAQTGKLHLVTSKTGRDGSIAIHQDADLWLAKLEPGQKVAHALAAGRHAWLHVAEGEVAVNGQELAAGDAAALDGPRAADVKALERAQVLLFDLN